ncbi:dephospho-CoA kinase [Rhodospirillales bacterium]|nr:dephospho-CoA kinase [Rhodospirillales bacterium]MDA8637518.1 dephospho-CoA kinase [Rhodospirillales bacterium]
MFILGLTGSIGMGKSTAAADFRRFRVPVHDSDAAVHAVMAKGGAAVAEIDQAFPGVVLNGVIDRQKLGAKVFGDGPALKKLEAILHPLVRERERAFLAHHGRLGTRAVVLDVPLLFETNGQRRCDAVVVVSAPFREQKRRVMARPGMTEEKFQNILKTQISDQIKKTKADFVVYSGLGRAHSLRTIREIVTLARSKRGQKWPPFGHGIRHK